MFAKNCLLYWIAAIENKYIFNVGCTFCDFFSMLFPEAPASDGKKNLKWLFLHCTSVGMSSESVSQIFEILIQTGNTNIFALHGVFFSRSVREKSPFSDDAVKPETHFSR